MDYIVEFGVEEIPAHECQSIYEQLTEGLLEDLLKKNNFKFKRTEVYITPSRIAWLIEDVDISKSEKYIKGPPIEQVLTDGRINEKGKKFAESHEVALRKLKKKKFGNKELLCIRRNVKEVVGEKLVKLNGKVLKSLQFSETMRWNSTDARFIRPVRWITSVLDTVPLTFDFWGLTSSSLSYGARFSGKTKIKIREPKDYAESLKDYCVIVSAEERKDMILDQIKKIEKENNVKVQIDEELLQEIIYLVEFPKVVLGEYKSKYLELPQEVIAEVLAKHQKSFIVKKGRKVDAHFITVINQKDDHIDEIREGWEKVINARLGDGLFYYNRDKEESLEEWRKKLEGIVVHEDIGSISDMVENLEEKETSLRGGLTKESKELLKKVIPYVNIDLGTNLVNEFPRLHGEIGAIYLKERDKLSAEEANLLRELASSKVSLREITDEAAIGRIELAMLKLSEFINIGVSYQGSKDPFGLRGYVKEILNVIWENNLSMTLEDLIDAKRGRYYFIDREKVEDTKELFLGRIKSTLTREGIDTELVNEAISLFEERDLNDFKAIVEDINKLEMDENDWYIELKEAFNRVNRVVASADAEVEGAESTPKAEMNKKLYKKIVQAEKDIQKENTLDDQLELLSDLNELVKEYFENVMVMDKDKKKKMENLSVLQKYLVLFKSLGVVELLAN
jgi:glycyl-tRNA synthetase beta chain